MMNIKKEVIFDIINKLPRNISRTEYELEEIQDGCYVGLGPKQQFALVLRSRTGERHPAISTQNIEFIYNEKYNLKINGKSVRQFVHVLNFHSDDHDVELFSDICMLMLQEKDDESLRMKILQLIEVFKETENNKNLQGLYGELLTGVIIYNKFDENILDKWQYFTNSKFDYNLSSRKKLEVKSTTSPIRIHNFGHEQLTDESKCIVVASVLLRKDDSGLSLLELINFYLEKSINTDLQKIRLLAIKKNNSAKDLAQYHYDLEYSKENLKFYSTRNIPKINKPINSNIFDVRYKVNLTTQKELTDAELLNFLKD